MRQLCTIVCLLWLTSLALPVYSLSGRVCSERRSRVESFVGRQRVSYRERYTTSCGPFGWRRCTRHRTKYRFVTARQTRTVFNNAQVCCSGWRLDSTGQSCSVHDQSPSLTYCPSDMTLEAMGRTADVRWRQPQFREPFDYRMTLSSTYPANRATLTWGNHRITYTARSSNNGLEVSCSFTVTVKPPLANPIIDGQQHGSVVNAEVDTPLTLTCRVDCEKPPFHLTWMKRQPGVLINIRNGTGHDIQFCGFQDYLSAVSTLTYTPQLDDDNVTLTCVDVMSTPSRPKQVSVRLRVSYTRHPDLVMCPANITTAADGEETNVSWPEPEFSEALGFELNVTSTFGTNTTSLGWGEHRVEYRARNTYNNMDTSCVFYVEVTPPPDMPEIAGYSNGSTVYAQVGTAITLVCRADHGDSPYRLTWYSDPHEIHDGTRYYTEPHDFRNLTNAINELTFIPTLVDNNMTLTCVASKSEPERIERVVITLNVSYTTAPTLEFCPENQTLEAARGEWVNVSWPEPEFSESLGFRLDITSTFGTNTTSLGWGEHIVEYTARNMYNDMESACMFFVDVRPPLGELLIVGHENNSILHLTVGTPITLTCIADYGDPPYLLTWRNRLELNDETTTVAETTTINIASTDSVRLRNDTEDVGDVTSGPTSMDTSTLSNGYFTANTTEPTSENNTVFVNETLLQNNDSGESINETTRVLETIWPNWTGANTTGWDNKSPRIFVRSLNETGTTYDKATTTTSVDSAETTTELLYNSLGGTDRTYTEYQNNATYTTAQSTTNAEWTTDYDVGSTTKHPTYKPEEEPFQVINSLPGSRYETAPSGYRQTQNATNRLTFVPRFDDDNTTLYCVATKDSRRLLVAVSLNVTGLPEVTTQPESTESALPTESTGVVQPVGPSTEKHETGGDYVWLVIAASSVGAIALLGAIVATIYYRRRRKGQLLLDDNAKETDNGHNFDNPVYETIE